jgi:hypothetical protein
VSNSRVRNPFFVGWALLSAAFGCGEGSGPEGLGNIEVHTLTAGDFPDADGYQVTVDDEQLATAPITGTVAISNVPAGNRSVRLVGVAESCTVGEENPKIVAVTAGETASAIFDIVCAGGVGSIEVHTQTDGDVPDADGYVVMVDYNSLATIPVNGMVTISSVAGNHNVGLASVAAHCTVSGDNPRTITVTADETALASFSIACGDVAEVGNIEINTATTGEFPDPNGYEVTVDNVPLTRVLASGSTRIPNVPVGSHSVGLGEIAEHCTVSGDNPKTVTVRLGETSSTGFNVVCSNEKGSLQVQVTTTGESIDEDGYTIFAQDQSQIVASNGAALFTDLLATGTDVQIDGVAANCALVSPAPVRVLVPARGVVQAQFTFSCLGPLPHDIVFSGFPESNFPPTEIVRVNASGARLRNVTMSPAEEDESAASPDGSRVAFIRRVGGRPASPFHLFVMDADGTNVVDLNLNIPFRTPTWSPDGTRLAGSDGLNIFIVNSDGSGLTQVTDHVPTPEVGEHFDSPNWAPDGTRIAYNGTPGSGELACHIVNTDGTGNVKIKDQCASPAWSPDGSKIAFNDPAGHLFVMRTDGSDVTDLSVVTPPYIDGGDARDRSPAWSPDGGQIAVSSTRSFPEERVGPDSRLVVMNADGTGVRRVTSARVHIIGRPSWVPALP